MRQSDQLLTRLTGEIEEQQSFQDKLIEDAQRDSRDLTANDMELFERSKTRMAALREQLGPVKESLEISAEASQTLQEVSRRMRDQEANKPDAIEYRSAGGYVLDYWRAGLGVEEAVKRLDLFNRAAAHQTTSDNPGLLPQQILEPVINFVDSSRPLTTALGPRNLPSGSWSRPKISQHTKVAPQPGEKTELVSQKMIIGMIPVTAETYGGYVNVSRQNIDWTQPAIMDLVINDLAGVYAEETEKALCAAIDAATTAGGTLPASPTPDDVAGAIWAAVGASYAALKGAGRTIIAVSPDMLGLVGPLFAPVNPVNAQGSGFSASDFASGATGTISGLSVVMSPGFDAGTMIVLNTAAVEVYEDRIGSLQVVEPSVLGVQVAYAGYFAPLVIEPDGIVEITGTP